ncbi:uncharacterized protein LOC130420929 isoform X6 [Triplophysa dalaica]|uniref:uncharacterized protein LOC130420929 isoform X6 n=2 Tax=Triplophysa dalaica TaxID=1582913 RepID=UPI0024DFFE0C|nr:uncharacterized protein LOC130420929 isoform X6 [Triplophysa dalaica]
MPGNTQKLCPGCNTLISVAFKTCPLCKQLQPYKTKVAKKRCNFQNKKAEWKKSIEKNNNRTVVLNSCHVMLDKLAALDFFPILLLGKKLKGKLVADAILGGDYVLDPDLFQRVKLMYEAVLKIHCQRQKKATSSTETTDPPEATSTSPPEATATSPPEATGIDITGSSEATRPQAQKAKNRPRNEVHYPVQQMEASKKKKKYECPECCRRVSQNNFDYSKVLKKRVREGTEEVLIRWVPCKTWLLEYAFVLGLGWQPERIPTNPARRFMRSNWSWLSAGTLSREHHNAAGSILGQEVEK